MIKQSHLLLYSKYVVHIQKQAPSPICAMSTVEGGGDSGRYGNIIVTIQYRARDLC